MTESGGFNDHVNEYKVTYEIKTKANGELQTYVKFRTNEESMGAESVVFEYENLNKLLKEKGYKVVGDISFD